MNFNDIKLINKELLKQSPEDILRYVKKTFSTPCMLTAFGYSGIVLLDMIKKIMPDIEIYFINTNRHFKETIDVFEYYKAKLNIIEIKTKLNENEINEKFGANLENIDPDLCCNIRKVEPLLDVINNKDIIISALRREQSPTRNKLDIIELDSRNTFKVYPIINWSKKQTWDYIKSKNLFYNTLHDKGYPSIGCECCTKPVKDNEDERSGRWTNIPKLECGIHSHRKKNA